MTIISVKSWAIITAFVLAMDGTPDVCEIVAKPG